MEDDLVVFENNSKITDLKTKIENKESEILNIKEEYAKLKKKFMDICLTNIKKEIQNLCMRELQKCDYGFEEKNIICKILDKLMKINLDEDDCNNP